jgi:hypothetical protein
LADGILLERRGVPAVSICTDKFHVTAVAMARLQGFPDYRFVEVPHPIASLSLVEVRNLARACLDEVLAILGVSR